MDLNKINEAVDELMNEACRIYPDTSGHGTKEMELVNALNAYVIQQEIKR